jgi:hypothetical protein
MVEGFLSAGFSSSKFTLGLSYLAFADALRPSNDRALEGDLMLPQGAVLAPPFFRQLDERPRHRPYQSETSIDQVRQNEK